MSLASLHSLELGGDATEYVDTSTIEEQMVPQTFTKELQGHPMEDSVDHQNKRLQTESPLYSLFQPAYHALFQKMESYLNREEALSVRLAPIFPTIEMQPLINALKVRLKNSVRVLSIKCSRLNAIFPFLYEYFIIFLPSLLQALNLTTMYWFIFRFRNSRGILTTYTQSCRPLPTRSWLSAWAAQYSLVTLPLWLE